MSLKLRGVRNAGIHESERVVYRAAKDLDLGFFIVFRGQKTGDKYGTDLSKAFWLPDMKVRAKDLVVIYSKEGNNRKKKNEDGSTSYFLYWGEREPVWNEPNLVVGLIEATAWTFEPVSTQEAEVEPPD